jgi:hypothetical protein
MLQLVREEFPQTFFCSQILDLKTGIITAPIEFCESELGPYPNGSYVLYPEEVFQEPEDKIQIPYCNSLRFYLELYNSGVFDFSSLFQQGLKLDPPESVPLFITPQMVSDITSQLDGYDKVCPFFEYIDLKLNAICIIDYYNDIWCNTLMTCWGKKYDIEWLPTPEMASGEYQQWELEHKKNLQKWCPNISLEHKFTIRQSEVDAYPEVRVTQLPKQWPLIDVSQYPTDDYWIG